MTSQELWQIRRMQRVTADLSIAANAVDGAWLRLDEPDAEIPGTRPYLDELEAIGRRLPAINAELWKLAFGVSSAQGERLPRQ